MKPFIKWPGGKEKEVEIIHKFFPQTMNRYFEPFVGGGAVYFSLDNSKYTDVQKYINDISTELIDLYRYIKEDNKLFFDSIKKIEHNWDILEKVIKKHSKELLGYYYQFEKNEISETDLLNSIEQFVIKYEDDFNGVLNDKDFNPCIELFKKTIITYLVRRLKRLKTLSTSNDLQEIDILNAIETAFKGSFYNHYRYIYNKREEINIKKEFASAIYYFIRENCYASMFRYNKYGEFNIPYGGMAYNKKNFENKIVNKELKKYIKSTAIENQDFMDFLKKYSPKKGDFIFVDPPYDSDFSKYSNTDFLKEDHKRLCGYLKKLDANIMIVIKETEYIEKLYSSNGFKVEKFNKTYLVNCKNRNNRKTTHLIITNY